ncbi:hypothetical protein PMHK_47370 [Pseudomonas sp. MHK4]|jgi:hypothetical protein
MLETRAARLKPDGITAKGILLSLGLEKVLTIQRTPALWPALYMLPHAQTAFRGDIRNIAKLPKIKKKIAWWRSFFPAPAFGQQVFSPRANEPATPARQPPVPVAWPDTPWDDGVSTA